MIGIVNVEREGGNESNERRLRLDLVRSVHDVEIKRVKTRTRTRTEKKGGRTNERTDCLFSSSASAIKYEYKK